MNLARFLVSGNCTPQRCDAVGVFPSAVLDTRQHITQLGGIGITGPDGLKQCLGQLQFGQFHCDSRGGEDARRVRSLRFDAVESDAGLIPISCVIVRTRERGHRFRPKAHLVRNRFQHLDSCAVLFRFLRDHSQQQNRGAIVRLLPDDAVQIFLRRGEIAEHKLVPRKITPRGYIARINSQSLLEKLIRLLQFVLHPQRGAQQGQVLGVIRGQLHRFAQLSFSGRRVGLANELPGAFSVVLRCRGGVLRCR